MPNFLAELKIFDLLNKKKNLVNSIIFPMFINNLRHILKISSNVENSILNNNGLCFNFQVHTIFSLTSLTFRQALLF